MKTILIALLFTSSILLTGCGSSITGVSLDAAKKNKKAIPYYLPQPYLLVTKDYSHLGTKTTKTEKTKPADKQKQDEKPSGTATEETTTTEPVSITVNGFTYKIIYLPNLAEKYGLVYNTGSGVSDISFTLKDGWMFTGLNLKSDTQIDETITAMSSFIGSIAKTMAQFTATKAPTWPVPKPETKLEPAIWLFKMTFDGEKITFDRVTLDFNI